MRVQSSRLDLCHKKDERGERKWKEERKKMIQEEGHEMRSC